MIYLPDTNVCIKYINQKDSPILRKLRSIPRQDVVLCDIVKFELYYGAYKSTRQEKNLAILHEFFSEFVQCLPFDEQAIIKAAQIRAQLAAKGTPIGPYDLQIAAIALVNDLILVTHNTREFSRIEGLVIEDWE
ncbi:MAG: type II toxin-antitoxin system VapC family toxin [Candidatus Parabeggiatoa sp. nov. 3]|nr:MAG: type II toxin-antitoxin system VapC family toxin [Gammaproteobacteria bacterium]RKZ68196.1 MAG: type II toxin-antitoxin system VapC family toxin [Gammaproteobacteria bacterium]RKZ85849.1 MAG: type II toxin-antitoxin system VapC family toxin [Gammaproteobacteria bacterium]HIE01217.1 type II toxin-antitoxin system VapC family toxin [Thiotrichaceae bacterium]